MIVIFRSFQLICIPQIPGSSREAMNAVFLVLTASLVSLVGSACTADTYKNGNYCVCRNGMPCAGPECAIAKKDTQIIHGYRQTCVNCTCVRERRVVICLSLPRSGSTVLSQLLNAYAPEVFVFVEPCRWSGMHTCPIPELATCKVFDRPDKAFYDVYWPYACDFVGNLSPRFNQRCKSKQLTSEDRLLLKERCLAANVIFVKLIAQTPQMLTQEVSAVEGKGQLIVVTREVTATINSMYTAELYWYPLWQQRSHPEQLVSAFCETNEGLMRVKEKAALVVEYKDIAPMRIPRVLAGIGVQSNASINFAVLSKKSYVSYNKKFEVPWHRMTCDQASQGVADLECDPAAPPESALSCQAVCRCADVAPRVLEIAAVHSEATYRLAHVLQAHPDVMVFLFPCSLAYSQPCSVKSLVDCSYFSAIASRSMTMHPAQCALLAATHFTFNFTANYTLGFTKRCIANKMMNSELAVIRHRCTAARTVAILRSPQSVVGTRLDDKVPPALTSPVGLAAWAARGTAVLRSDLAADVRRYANLLAHRDDGGRVETPEELRARATRTVCAAHVAMDYLVRAETAVELAAPAGSVWPEVDVETVLRQLEIPSTPEALQGGQTDMRDVFRAWLEAGAGDAEPVTCPTE